MRSFSSWRRLSFRDLLRSSPAALLFDITSAGVFLPIARGSDREHSAEPPAGGLSSTQKVSI